MRLRTASFSTACTQLVTFVDEACLEVFRAHRSAKMPRAFAVQLNARVFAAIDQHVHVSALEQAPGLLRSLGLRQQDTLGGLWVVAVLGANFDQLVKPLAQLLELVASGRIVRVPHLVAEGLKVLDQRLALRGAFLRGQLEVRRVLAVHEDPAWRAVHVDQGILHRRAGELRVPQGSLAIDSVEGIVGINEQDPVIVSGLQESAHRVDGGLHSRRVAAQS